MIIEVTETVYKGIYIERVKDQGWKCDLGGQEYLFPHYTAAQSAIDEIFRDIKPIVTKCKGVKQKAQSAKDNDFTMSKQMFALMPDLMQGEYEHLQLVLGLLKQQKEALKSNDFAEVKRINNVLIEDTETNLDSFVSGV